MSERLLGCQQSQRDACECIMRAHTPLLVIDLRGQAQPLLPMRQRGTQLSKGGTYPTEDDFGKRFPGSPLHLASQLQRLRYITLTFRKAPVEGAAHESTPWTGKGRAHGKTGAQHAVVVHHT